ncbi:MAG TPA: bifunctional YncE family protein/alkaline phosphatase family protein [Candidatus Acidoferrum sp.]|nr:bifunctional YncE family protein/alkaline phosphatase family protein [Candidatus Acidoferrum sp.]
MKTKSSICLGLLLMLTLSLNTAADEKAVLLPNGWAISPAGQQLPLGGMPLKLAPVPGGRYALAMSSGYTEHFLGVIDATSGRVAQHLPIAEGWMGLALSPEGDQVFASGGSKDCILTFQFANGALKPTGQIALPKGTFPAGLAVGSRGRRLYITGNLGNALLVLDLPSGKLVAAIPVGNKPYTCVISRNEKTAYVSNWGEDNVAVVDLSAGRVLRNIQVQEKPNDLLLTPDATRLFVANGNRNTVSVLDTKDGRVIEQIDAGIVPKAPLGSTPNALALTSDGKTLYVADADNNAVAVVDVSRPGHSISRGYIPSGWYPTAVCLSGKGSEARLLIANGKGARSQPNAAQWKASRESGRKGLGDSKNAAFIAALLQGTVSLLPLPDGPTLARYSEQVHQNSPYASARPAVAPPIPAGRNCPIRHVIYIIKENRTYDQILGDMKEGNGSPECCLFPEKVTPNQHALAREFVLFDALFHNAEVSADGHHWVTSAYATDYVQKFWPTMYAGHTGGRVDLHDDPVAYSAGGFIWDLCAKAGLSYRSYGEFARIRGAEKGKVRPATPSLVGHIHPTYKGADGIGLMTDVARFELWAAEFREFEKHGDLPSFEVLSLPNDHTVGTRPGKPTPRAMVADNDLALGRIVETVSHSRFWPNTAIFVIEDDAQNGPDHVDCHRTVGLVISPYTRRHRVDSTMYSSSSMLRTMEGILGLPPLTQYDAAATPMWAAFQSTPDLTPYGARPNGVPLDELNTTKAFGAQRSQKMSLEVADTAPEDELNEIIWKSVRGDGSAVPPRRVAAFVLERPSSDHDDD